MNTKNKIKGAEINLLRTTARLRLNEEEIQDKVRKLSVLKGISLTFLLLSVLTFVFYFITLTDLIKWEIPLSMLSPVLISSVAVLIISGILYSVFSGKLKDFLSENVIHDILAKNFELIEYRHYISISDSLLREVKMPSWESSRGDHYIKAKYKEASFEFSNIELYISGSGDDSDQTVFKGIWLVIHLDKEITAQVIENSNKFFTYTENNVHIIQTRPFLFQSGIVKSVQDFREEMKIDVNLIKGMIDEFLEKVYYAGS